MARDSQASAGYWEIVQDALADVVRIMLSRCFQENEYPELAAHCRNLRGELWVCAFPNLFVTVAPAEWKFQMPYFLHAYINWIVGGAYLMALHMSMELLLAAFANSIYRYVYSLSIQGFWGPVLTQCSHL
mgnify:CR=1 FL=1